MTNNNKATNFVKSFKTMKSDDTRLGKKFRCTYDDLGNISEIYENNALKVQYLYDNLNRLQKENNGYSGEIVKYEYDFSGNISKNIFTKMQAKHAQENCYL